MAARVRGRLLGHEGPAFSSRLKTSIHVSIASDLPVAAAERRRADAGGKDEGCWECEIRA